MYPKKLFCILPLVSLRTGSSFVVRKTPHATDERPGPTCRITGCCWQCTAEPAPVPLFYLVPLSRRCLQRIRVIPLYHGSGRRVFGVPSPTGFAKAFVESALPRTSSRSSVARVFSFWTTSKSFDVEECRWLRHRVKKRGIVGSGGGAFHALSSRWSAKIIKTYRNGFTKSRIVLGAGAV